MAVHECKFVCLLFQNVAFMLTSKRCSITKENGLIGIHHETKSYAHERKSFSSIITSLVYNGIATYITEYLVWQVEIAHSRLLPSLNRSGLGRYPFKRNK
jgi:hypothetical protein